MIYNFDLMFNFTLISISFLICMYNSFFIIRLFIIISNNNNYQYLEQIIYNVTNMFKFHVIDILEFNSRTKLFLIIGMWREI